MGDLVRDAVSAAVDYWPEIRVKCFEFGVKTGAIEIRLSANRRKVAVLAGYRLVTDFGALFLHFGAFQRI